MTTLESRMTALESDASATRETLKDLMDGQRHLDLKLDEMQGDIKELQSDVQTLKGDVTVLKVNLNHANSKIAIVEKKVDAIIALLEG